MSDRCLYKRVDDGIVLVNETIASVAVCALGPVLTGLEMDPVEQVMKKCTLCVDRIYNEHLPKRTVSRHVFGRVRQAREHW